MLLLSQSPIGSGPDMDLISCWNVFEMRLRSQSPIGSGPDMDNMEQKHKERLLAESQSPIGSGPDMDLPVRGGGESQSPWQSHNRLSAPVPIWTLHLNRCHCSASCIGHNRLSAPVPIWTPQIGRYQWATKYVTVTIAYRLRSRYGRPGVQLDHTGDLHPGGHNRLSAPVPIWTPGQRAWVETCD